MKKWLYFAIYLTLVACVADSPFSDAWTTARTFAGTRKITNSQGHGTGFFVKADSKRFYLVTAAHVTNPGTVSINGRPATVIATHATQDLSLISVKRDKHLWQQYEFAIPHLQEQVTLLGYAGRFGTPLINTGHVSSISFEGGHVTFDGGCHPGQSGGPLVNNNGRVVAMIVMMPSMYGMFPNPTVAICVPSKVIKKFIKENL